MVLRQAFWLISGIGAAAFPIHVQLHQGLKKEQQMIHEEFKRQRELVFYYKMKQLELGNK